jgi:rhodanese-related sulfurtransferase
MAGDKGKFMPFRSFSSQILKLLFLLFLSSALALIFNALRPSGIPLVENWEEKMAAKELPEGIRKVEFHDAVEYFSQGHALFVDARDETFYRLSHIQGALNLPVRDFDVMYPLLKDKLDFDRFIIVYCDGSHCEMSEELAARLIGEGYGQVGVYTGGIEEWMERGMPVSTGDDS